MIRNLFTNKILLPHQYYYPHMDLVKDRSSLIKEQEFYNDINESREGNTNEAIIYIHIPFCDSKCTFCSFDKAYLLENIEKYLKVLYTEIEFYSKKKYISSLKISSIHIGGGTPSLLSGKQLGALIKKVRSEFDANKAIINIEGSANTIYKDEIIQIIKDEKVSRVSVGVQTFDEKLRSEYSTKSTLNDVYLCLEVLKKNRIITYIDIMYGFPKFNETDENSIIKSDLKIASELGIDGIDFGQLYPFYNYLEQIIKERNLRFSTSKEIVNIIKNSTQMLESNGYTQKSAYAFSKIGEIIIENSYYGGKTKSIPDCLALGSSSFGLLNGYKYRNNTFASYMKNEATGFSQMKKLTMDKLNNLNVFGFPKVLGLNKIDLKERITPEIKKKLDILLEYNLIEEHGEDIILTYEGKCYIDNIYFFMLDEIEQKLIEKQLKIHVL